MRFTLAVFIAFIFLMVLMTTNTQAAVIKIATLSPDGSFWMQKMREGAKEVESKTNKRVRFKFYPGGVMGDDKAVLRKIRFGQLHGAAVTNGSLNVFDPDIQLYNLVMKFNSLKEIDYVRQQLDDKLMRSLAQSKIEPIGFAEMGFAYLMTKHPINDVSEFRKYKAWVPEGNHIAESALDAFSVSAIPLAMRDVLIGLQTGMIDVVAASPVGALALQWHTQIQYFIDLPVSYIFGVFIIDKKTLNKLSSDDRKIVKSVMGGVIAEIDKKSRQDNVAATQAIYNQGIKKIELTADAVAELQDLISSANDNLIKTGKVTPSLVEELDKLILTFRNGNL